MSKAVSCEFNHDLSDGDEHGKAVSRAGKKRTKHRHGVGRRKKTLRRNMDDDGYVACSDGKKKAGASSVDLVGR
jgi:hypothetical protein